MENELGNRIRGMGMGVRKTAQVATTFNVLNLIIPQQLSIMQSLRLKKGQASALSHAK